MALNLNIKSSSVATNLPSNTPLDLVDNIRTKSSFPEINEMALGLTSYGSTETDTACNYIISENHINHNYGEYPGNFFNTFLSTFS